MLDRLAEHAVLVIPGRTSISGRHVGLEAVHDVLNRAYGRGLKQDVVEIAEGIENTAYELVRHHLDGVPYDTVQVCDIGEFSRPERLDYGVLSWRWFIHDYDVFAQAWA